MRIITALAALLLALCTAPTAAAEETVPVPEGAPGIPGQPFADSESLIDLHPLHIESWTRAQRADAVVVSFMTGTPQCYGVHTSVRETPDAVIVDLLGGTLPEAVNRPCIKIAVAGTLEVPLQAPLGDRAVLTTRLDKPH
ncbi:hypothetical protein [Mycolicibacterium sp.]|uniref:hypothetical protein n=1 Tax=Mycolicibacterium sp. TaxID=2320850 RepID=UPI00355D50E1